MSVAPRCSRVAGGVSGPPRAGLFGSSATISPCGWIGDRVSILVRGLRQAGSRLGDGAVRPDRTTAEPPPARSEEIRSAFDWRPRGPLPAHEPSGDLTLRRHCPKIHADGNPELRGTRPPSSRVGPGRKIILVRGNNAAGPRISSIRGHRSIPAPRINERLSLTGEFKFIATRSCSHPSTPFAVTDAARTSFEGDLKGDGVSDFQPPLNPLKGRAALAAGDFAD
jgi:hypothetical protein